MRATHNRFSGFRVPKLFPPDTPPDPEPDPTGAPTITSVLPASGPGGTVITVDGTDLDVTTGVTLFGATATFTMVNETRLLVTAPAHADGATTLVVTTPFGSASTAWTYATTPGTPPAPANVTAGVPASKMIAWGGYGHAISSPAFYATWKTWGFGGYKCHLSGNPYFVGWGGNQRMIGSSAVPLGSAYDWQKAYEGFGSPPVNGGVPGTQYNFGPFRAKVTDPSLEVYIGLYMVASTQTPTKAPFGSWWDNTAWADICDQIGDFAAGVKFLGGDGLSFDFEDKLGNQWQAPPNEVQQVAVTASGGTFTLSFGGQTTTAIGFAASTGTVQNALNALSTVDAVTVFRGPLTNTTTGAHLPISVSFGGTQANTNLALMTANGANLTGGGVSVTAIQDGTTNTAWETQIEQRGYEFATAIYTNFPNAKIILYSWYMSWGWHLQQYFNNIGGSVANNSDSRPWAAITAFIFGMWRAKATLTAPGAFTIFDATFYHDDPNSNSQVPGATMPIALKWNTQGPMAYFSRQLPSATRNYVMDKIFISPFSWAGTDNTNFYNNTQDGQPAFTNQLEQFRKYGMGGRRAEYNKASGANPPMGTPNEISGSGTTPLASGYGGIYPAQNQYSGPAGRVAGMLASASTTSQDSTAPTMSTPAVSGSGSTRTVTGTASHGVYGIAYVKGYVYPSGSPVVAVMNWNLNGGGWTSLGNDFMEYTISLTGVSAGNFAIITAYSTIGQQSSKVVAL